MTKETAPVKDEGRGVGYWNEVYDSARCFFGLPSQLLVVLLLEAINSFRYYGIRFVLYTYITNEFHLSDEEAGLLLSVKGTLEIIFGLAGSVLVDRIGVRRTAIFALSVAVVGRSLFAFGRSTSALYAAAWFFGPLGEALLNIGLYRVAIKKLTTPRTRPLAFAIAYAASNMAGALADISIDVARRMPDATIGGFVFTPTRIVVVVTLGAVLLALAIAVLFLTDVTVFDLDDPEDGVVVPDDAVDSRPMVPSLGDGRCGRCKVFKTDLGSSSSSSDEASEAAEENGRNISLRDRILEGLSQTTQQLGELFRCRNLWSVVLFGAVSVFVTFQWSASELVLPPYLERTFGERAPIFTVQSINFWGCLMLPPVVGVLTGPLENFSVILPGMWVMAISPLAMFLRPTVAGACLWQVFLTLGEVFWSPRAQSWTALLAPTGREGLFFALASSRELFVPMGDYILGEMNERYNPNCPDCRDQYGHFCGSFETVDMDINAGVQLYQCVSEEEACASLPLLEYPDACPDSCQRCPNWDQQIHTLWTILLVASLASPVLVWILLPFLRGRHRFSDKFFGIFRCSFGRFLGICGFDDSKSYERVDTKGQVKEFSDSDVTISDSKSDSGSIAGDLELT